MQAQPWAGNVRELENLLHRQYLLADGKSIDLTSSQEPPAPAGDKAEPAFAEAKAKFVAAFERTYLERLIVDAGGNISLAARRAGKDRSALRRLLHKHGLNVSHAD
jgi:DNA-binding NtrC family response regulator